MVANITECSRFTERSVIKFLIAEKWKPCEIYEEACFSQMFTNGLKFQMKVQIVF